MLPSALRTGLFSPQGEGRGPVYVPAHVHYMLIFCPRITEHLSVEDPARLSDQVLFFTSIENPVSQGTIVRQVALANALVDFASSQHRNQHDNEEPGLRRLAVSSDARRLLLLEVQPHFWVHVVRYPSSHRAYLLHSGYLRNGLQNSCHGSFRTGPCNSYKMPGICGRYAVHYLHRSAMVIQKQYSRISGVEILNRALNTFSPNGSGSGTWSARNRPLCMPPLRPPHMSGSWQKQVPL